MHFGLYLGALATHAPCQNGLHIIDSTKTPQTPDPDARERVFQKRFMQPVPREVGGNDFIGAQKNYNPCARGNCWPWFITFGYRRKMDCVAEHIQARAARTQARGLFFSCNL